MQAGAHNRRRPPPEALDKRTSASGLRAVAVFEAVKGVAVLLLGLGLLSLLHKDVESAAEVLLAHLHVREDARLSRVFLEAASRMTDTRLWSFAAGAAAYSFVRFTEAWGLWHRRVWAEWFALLSGAIYIPWEIAKILERPNALHFLTISANVAIVAYMAYIRIEACRRGDCDD